MNLHFILNSELITLLFIPFVLNVLDRAYISNYLAAKSKIIVEFQNGSDPIVRASRWKTQSRPISVCQSLGQLRKPKAKSIYHLVFFHRTLVRG